MCQSLHGVLDKDVSHLQACEGVVENRKVREWTNAECGLQVMVHSGKKACAHPGFLATSPAE
eukprot:8353155-Prorocentrum_lima.AAC.1